MIGFNGGLIGGFRDTTTETASVPGVWTANEQVVGRRRGQWLGNDLFFSSVSLLLPGDGTNGSTSIIDRSPSPKTITVAGNAQISTAQSRFGGSSIAFDGTGDRLDIASNIAFDLETGSYTVEFWVWFNSRVAGTRTITLEGSSESVGIIAAGTSNNDLQLNHYGTGARINAVGALTNKDNLWLYITLCSDGTNRRLFLDGIQVGSSASRVLPTGSCSLGIGGNTVSNPATNLNGFIDDLRITKGVARYTSNFTPPAAPHPIF